MNISETMETIAQGVREHIWMVEGMTGEYPELFATMQVAFQVLSAFHPVERSVEEEREFIVLCGFTEDDAKFMVKDNEAGGIY